LSRAARTTIARAVLIVVEHGDVELGAQAPLDLEATRRGDVLEVDAAERRRRRLHERDDLVHVLGIDAQREGVDAGELLEEHRLALHHGHRRLRTDIAEAEHRRAVGDDRHRIALDGQRPRRRRVVVDGHRDAPYARRVSHREIVARLQRQLGIDLDLATLVHQERAIRDAVDGDSVEIAHRAYDRLGMTRVHARDRHVANDLIGLDAHQVDRAEHRPCVGDGVSDSSERAALLGQMQAHREAIGRRGLQAPARRARDLL
jgi:hypothetical protein